MPAPIARANGRKSKVRSGRARVCAPEGADGAGGAHDRSRPRRGELRGRACHLPRVHAAMQHTNKGGVRHGYVEWLRCGLSPPERHECPQNDLIPASCGSTTARMSSSWPCIRTPSPTSSCPEARASPRAWASFLPSSHACGADRWLELGTIHCTSRNDHVTVSD